MVSGNDNRMLNEPTALRSNVDQASPKPMIGNRDLLLRDVLDGDLAILFDQQRDPDANAMAGFPARDWHAFTTHLTKIRGDDTIVMQAIVVAGQVAGSIVSWEQDGENEVGY